MPRGRPQRKRINARGYAKTAVLKPCVYRYIDLQDGIVKYVGIVKNSPLEKRIMQHSYVDEWCKSGLWRIEYFECETQSEVEAFEAHLIELYGTWKYYNKMKARWGINRFLPNVENWWKKFVESPYADEKTRSVVLLFRKLLREGKRDEAIKIANIFDVTFDVYEGSD